MKRRTLIEWKDIKDDGLPTEGELCLVAVGEVVTFGYVCWIGGKWVNADSADTRPIRQDFTHWCNAHLKAIVV